MSGRSTELTPWRSVVALWLSAELWPALDSCRCVGVTRQSLSKTHETVAWTQ